MAMAIITADDGTQSLDLDHRIGAHRLHPVSGCDECDVWIQRVDGREWSTLIQSREIRLERRAAQALRRLEVAYGLNS